MRILPLFRNAELFSKDDISALKEETMETALLESPIVIALAGLGALFFISFVWKALCATYKTFIRRGKDPKKLGKWAVVTGATDGIGKAYAFALAKKGMSVVLISRTEAKLVMVAKEIDDKNYPGVETKYVVCDYSNFDKEARENVENVIGSLDIGVLVNNVGVSYKYPKYFTELADEDVASLMEMNVNSTTWMTRMVIKGMAERRRGCIVNISSAAGLYTMPLLSQYSAAKGYIEKFTRGINSEFASQGLTSHCQVPFYVASKLSKLREGFSVPSPEYYVGLAMKWIGHSDAVVSPYWVHAFQGWLMECLPSFVLERILMDMHLSIRRRGLRKDAAKQAEAEKKGL